MLQAPAAISGPQRDAGPGRPALGGEAQEGLWADESALRTAAAAAAAMAPGTRQSSKAHVLQAGKPQERPDPLTPPPLS